jgi:fatty-acyl-CoA synthase/long-chain acyl-CoA synthetase
LNCFSAASARPDVAETTRQEEFMAPLDTLAVHAQQIPDKLAVIDDRPDGTLTMLDYAHFNRDVNRLAHVLLARGVARGDKVVWCGMNSIGVVRAIHAARKIGAAAVPLNYRLTAEEAAFVVGDCEAAAVYVDADFADLIAGIRPELSKLRDVLVFGGSAGPGALEVESLMAEASAGEPPAAPDGSPAAATITYTSGTTGKPKGAVRRGLGDRTQVAKMIEHIGYTPDDVYLTTGPLYHSGPGGFMQIAQNMGNTIVIQRRFDPEDWLRLLEKYRATSTFSAPTPIRMLCNLPGAVKKKYDATSMKRMVANAAPWSYALKEAYLADFPEDSLWEVYGSTELGVNAILAPADQRRKKGSCGKPAPSVELRLFDEDGKEVREPGVPGELYVRSKTIFDTYYNAHDKYEEDRRGEFHTVGDMAYFDDEGFYYICDRKKDMIISGGMNIYPAEIEAALDQHPQIMDAAVFGIPDEQWGEAVHAVVVVRPGVSLSQQEIVSHAREHLAGYKIPRSVSFADEIPRTGSGKILKRVLREPWWKDHQSGVL